MVRRLRKICVVTGSRAEYGLLYWLMHEINQDQDLQLQVIATGMHLSPEFGLTYQVIEQDGFAIDAKVEMLLANDTPVAVTKSLGLGTIGFADAFAYLQPDIVVVLGDRYEVLAAAQAALVARIPLAHLHGGETTEGAFDEAIRHSVTKMAQIHFVAAESYRSRVIQMGENPNLVFNVGALCIDNISRLPILSLDEFEEAIDFKLGTTNFLVTYHPVTLEVESAKVQVERLLTALDNFPDARIIFTKANADTDGHLINSMLAEYCALQPLRAKLFSSLGQFRYLNAIRHINVVIGNSSSGLLEVPFFKKPTVNIGTRQQGRLKASSVIDADIDSNAIIKAIRIALSEKFRLGLIKTVSPYGLGNASSTIKEKLKEICLDDIIRKHFFDLN